MSAALKKWRESASLIIAAKTGLCKPKIYNYKLLCLKRSSKSGFMPNNYVFPGGNISKSDASPKWLEIFKKAGCSTAQLSALQPKENVPFVFDDKEADSIPKYLSFRICALRETFEECGILICKEKNSKTTDWAQNIGGEDVLKWQEKVHDDPQQFLNLCTQLDIIPDLWSLKLWSNWITPPSLPAQFNTIFFITTFQETPESRAEELEVQDIKWCDPEEYLQLSDEKRIVFPPPQLYELCRLQNFKDIDMLNKYIQDRSLRGCEPYFPYRIKIKEGECSILPGDDLYPKDIYNEYTKTMYLDHLPDSVVQNRMLHKPKNVNILYVNNLTPKDGHLPPLLYKN